MSYKNAEKRTAECYEHCLRDCRSVKYGMTGVQQPWHIANSKSVEIFARLYWESMHYTEVYSTQSYRYANFWNPPDI